MARAQKKEFEQALTLYNKAIEMDPQVRVDLRVCCRRDRILG